MAQAVMKTPAYTTRGSGDPIHLVLLVRFVENEGGKVINRVETYIAIPTAMNPKRTRINGLRLPALSDQYAIMTAITDAVM